MVAVGHGFLALFAQPHGTDPDSIFSRTINPGNEGHHRGDGHDDRRQNGHHNELRLDGVLLASSMPIAGFTDSSAPAASTAKARMAPLDVQRLDRVFAASLEAGTSFVLPRSRRNLSSFLDGDWVDAIP